MAAHPAAEEYERPGSAGDFTYADGLEAARRLLDRFAPDAILCSNDLLAFAVIRTLADRGLHVPDDVAVTGMDDTELTEMHLPSLTSVSLEAEARGRWAARMLLDRIDHPDLPPRRERGPVSGIVGPFYDDWKDRRPASPYHKGDGHVTDDTLMTGLLTRVYAARRDHLDAYDVASTLVPLMLNERIWIPELHEETIALKRVFLAEKWLVTRLHYAHADPREAGVGNMVNCGAAMYMAPVGIVNAGSPAGAYAEAVELASTHQLSYGREAAGVFAAAVARAMVPGATVASVVQACLDVARDGTRVAIAAVCDAAAGLSDPLAAAAPLRAAMSPFDTVGEDYRDQDLSARRPSRLHAIEELPVALGMLVVSGGDFRQAVLGGVNYGRDADSIATMAGAISGALHGMEAIPPEWAAGVAEGSRLDLQAGGRTMASVAREVFARDQERFSARTAAFTALTDSSGPSLGPVTRSPAPATGQAVDQ